MGDKVKPANAKSSRRINPPDQVDTDSMTPHFAFDQLVDGYEVRNCRDEAKIGFATTLIERSRMRWVDIVLAPRHGAGIEKIPRDRIQVGIPRGITEDVDHFLALRFHGNAPMVGYRVGRVFHVVWLDHDFSVYDHGT